MQRILTFIRLYLRNLFSRAAVTDTGSSVVVTLTSHSDRIQRAFAAVESIGLGTLRPRRLILFLGKRYESLPLPVSLKRLCSRGLEVMFVDEAGPHTKYYPYLQQSSDFCEPLVTADDDKMYSREWLERLVDAYRQHPAEINCWRARDIRLDADGLRPYREWRLCQSTEASATHFATGVGGVIYPPEFLRRLKRAGQAFSVCCPKADDLWLHVNALRAGFPVRQIHPQAREFPGVPRSSRTALQRTNVDQDGNDVQAAKTYSEEDLALLRAAVAAAEGCAPTGHLSMHR